MDSGKLKLYGIKFTLTDFIVSTYTNLIIDYVTLAANNVMVTLFQHVPI